MVQRFRMIALTLLVTITASVGWSATASADENGLSDDESSLPDDNPPAPPLPVVLNFLNGVAIGFQNPEMEPPGSNDWSCRVTRRHPRPVVLVHGTLGNIADDFWALSPFLKNNGYCVYAFNFGGEVGNPLKGFGPMEESAQQMSDFVDRVRKATHRLRVDLVGHSEGGPLSRYYLKHFDGARKVHTLVGLAPTNHGTTLWGIANLTKTFPILGAILNFFCASCFQQIEGSQFLTDLNAGGDTIPGVDYTVIGTRFDEIVTPQSSNWLTGPNVTNILIQDKCFLDFVEHLAITYDSVALQEVLNALDPATAKPPKCTLVLPLIGG